MTRAPALTLIGRDDDAHALGRAAAMLAQFDDVGALWDWHAEAARRRPLPAPGPEALSDAERRVLRLLSSPLTLREIGRELYLSVNTVKTHVHSIYRKLGVSSRNEAVRAARNERG